MTRSQATARSSSAPAAAPTDDGWWVYIVRCADGTLYTGIARHLDARIGEHNAGRGAKYTRGRLPVALVYAERSADRSAALQREHAIKRMAAADKRALAARTTPARSLSSADRDRPER